MLPNINIHWNKLVPTCVMFKVSQTIYHMMLFVDSKTNENAPSHMYSLSLLNLTNAYTYLLLEAGTKLIHLSLKNIEFKHSSWELSLHYIPHAWS